MALVFNNVTVPQSGNVIYNGTSLSVVKHGNTQVWKRAPEYLYNNGDQCSGFTGGWDARAAYFLNTDTYYRNQTGTKPVFNTGNISVTCTGSYLGGGSVITNWPPWRKSFAKTISIQTLSNTPTAIFWRCRIRSTRTTHTLLQSVCWATSKRPA